MRPLLAALLVFLSFGLWQPIPVCWSLDSQKPAVIYDANPTHLWNRLHSDIFIRTDIPSTARVPDALDPPLWYHTHYLLTKPSHERVLRILDEFLQTHGERLIQDPAKRAILERDLWSVFDWTVERAPDREGEPAYDRERQELQSRLGEVMRRVALTPGEIRALPSNYAQAVASGQFARAYDPEHSDRPFLPPDLFDPHGPWVRIFGLSGGITSEPMAPSHTETFSRSTFLILMRFPAGRKAVSDYLQTLWDLPQPWVPRPDDPRHEQTVENPVLPQFPAGTEVALVRQMLLFDNQGKLAVTPITESIQIRVYRSVAERERSNVDASSPAVIKDNGQDVYQVTLSRPQLFANKSGGLRATERDEKEFGTFSSFGPDMGNPKHYASLDQYEPVMQSCSWCHRGAGIYSLNSRSRLLKPNWLQRDDPGGYSPEGPWWAYENTGWKQNRYDWGLLSGYWKSGDGAH